MEHADWLERWQVGRTPFHLDQVNPWLLQFQDRLALTAGKRVLVPLCGKSLDMAHLAGLGARVTGVELAEKALLAFAREQDLEFRRDSGDSTVTLVADPFTLVAGDFFSLSDEQLGRFDAIWDRAALIALPAATRPAYARRLLSLLKPGGRLLLVNLEYDQACMEGPPFDVPLSEVEELFRAAGSFQMLAEKEISRKSHLHQSHEIPLLKERVFLITRPSRQEPVLC